MKELRISCKGISNSSIVCDEIDMTLQNVNMAFLEDVPYEDIVLYSDNNELLERIPIEDIIDFMSSSGYLINKE